MPLLVPVIIGVVALAGIGGAIYAGKEFGQTAGAGASDAFVIVGIGAAVGIVLYSVHASKRK